MLLLISSRTDNNFNDFMMRTVKICFLLSIIQRIVSELPTFIFVDVESTLTKVIIYGSNSEVYRKYSAQLSSGFSAIVLKGLPASLDENSIKLVNPNELVEILGISSHNVAILRKDDTSFNALLVDLNTLVQIIQTFLVESKLAHEAVNKRIQNINDYVDSIVTSYARKDGVSNDVVTAVFEFQDKNSEILLPKLSQLSIEIRSLEEDIVRVEEAIKRLTTEGDFIPLKLNNKNRLCQTKESCKWDYISTDHDQWPASGISKEVTVYLHISSTQHSHDISYAFTISYMTSPAQWAAEYDIFLTGDMDSHTGLYNVSVEYFASIDQTTEEDWKEVQLSLSTYLPTRATPPVYPSDRGITFRQTHSGESNNLAHIDVPHNSHRFGVYKSGGSGKATEGIKKVESDGGILYKSSGQSSFVQEDEVMKSFSASTVAEGDLGLTYFFTLPYPVTVRSNKATSSTRSSQAYADETRQSSVTSNRRHRLLITTLPVSVRLFSYVAPSTGAQVFLRATAKHLHNVPLLSCHNARLFLQASYTGTTEMPPTQPGAPLKLDFGVNKKILVKVHRDKPQYKGQDAEASNWFTFEKKRYRVKREDQSFHLTNLLEDKASLLLVHETLPRSTEEEIKVDVESPKLEEVLVLKGMNGPDLCLEAVLSHKFVTEGHAKSSRQVSAGAVITQPVAMQIFGCGSANDLIWAVWLGPTQHHQIQLKYKVLWPDDKHIHIA